MKKYIFFVLSLLISLSTFSQGIEIRRAGSGISIKDGNTTRTYPKGVGTLLEGGKLYLRTGQQIIRTIPSHTIVSVPSAPSLLALQDSILLMTAALPVISTGGGGEISSAAIHSALGYTPANASSLSAAQSALSSKANTSDVNNALDSKADVATVSEIQTTLASKANTSTVNSALALKADQTALTSGLASKANSSDVTSSLALKADASTVSTLSTTVSGKADATTVNSALALKADAATTTSSLAAKANTADVNIALDLKANTSTVNSALALKADATSVTSLLAAKADASTTTSALALKADATALTSGLAGKADISALTSGLAGKVGTTGDETIGGIKQWSTTQRFAGTWANKPLIVGTIGQSGVIAFARGSDGSTQGRFGYKSQGENNIIEAFAPGGSGAFEINTNGGTGLKVFSDGRTVIQKGGTYTNDAHHDLQVKGPALLSSFVKIGGSIETNPDSIKFFANNDAAIAGGVKINQWYYTVAENGDWIPKIAHAVSLEPIFGEKVSSGNTRMILGASYKAQSANEDHNNRRATNKTTPIYRFEVNRGEYWQTDSVNKNSNNIGGTTWVKERTEMYQEGADILFNQDVWVAYSFYIEPGADISYGVNTDFYCMLGQWHPGDGVPSGGPSWAIELSGQGTLTLITRGQEDLIPPFTGGRPWAVDRGITTVTRGAWHNIVVRARHNHLTNAGQIEWWVDGSPITLVGGGAAAIGNNYSKIGYWKFGIYRTSNAANLAVRYANVIVKVDPTNSNAVNSNTLKGLVSSPLPLTP